MIRALAFVVAVLASHVCSSQESPLASCMAGLESNQLLDPIRGKLALGPVSETTFQMYTIERRADDSEKPAISRWADGRERCMSRNAEHLQGQPPEQADLARRYHSATQRLIADLYTGSSTFADFNKRRSALYDEARRIEDAIIAKTNPPRTQQEMERDHAACEFEVQRAFAGARPSPNVDLGFRSSTQAERNFGRSLSTLAFGNPGLQQRENMYLACMRSKGWTPQQ